MKCPETAGCGYELMVLANGDGQVLACDVAKCKCPHAQVLLDALAEAEGRASDYFRGLEKKIFAYEQSQARVQELEVQRSAEESRYKAAMKLVEDAEAKRDMYKAIYKRSFDEGNL